MQLQYHPNAVVRELRFIKEHHESIGDFPSKAVVLHFHFAKLFVCSHVFRGLTSNATIDPMPVPFIDAAMTAISSAKAVLELVTQDADMSAAFIGLPHYFHTMIAFACSFLLKITTKFREQVAIEVQPIFELIGQVIELCKKNVCTPYHLVYWIGRGLQSLLTSCVTATSHRDRRKNQSVSQHLNAQNLERIQDASPQGTSSQNSRSDDFMDATESLGNVWDAAREAAMLFPTDRLPNIDFDTYPVQDPFRPAGVEGNTWDDSMASFDLEHMGFQLL